MHNCPNQRLSSLIKTPLHKASVKGNEEMAELQEKQQANKRKFLIGADGYIPYHFKVFVNAGSRMEFDQICENLRAVKVKYEKKGFASAVSEVENDIRTVTGVSDVVDEGALSSTLGALRTLVSLGYEAMISCTVGEGPVTDGVVISLGSRGISLKANRIIGQGDTSIEISVKEPVEKYDDEFQIHFLPSSKRKSKLMVQAHEIDGFLFSVINKGRGIMARKMRDMGKFVTGRVRLQRHAGIDEYIAVFPLCHLVVLGKKYLYPLVKALNLKLPPNWKAKPDDPLIAQICQSPKMGGGIVAVSFGNVWTLCHREAGCAVFQHPQGARLGNARTHGALIAECIERMNNDYRPGDLDDLVKMGNRALERSDFGASEKPMGYPDLSFEPVGNWCTKDYPL